MSTAQPDLPSAPRQAEVVDRAVEPVGQAVVQTVRSVTSAPSATGGLPDAKHVVAEANRVVSDATGTVPDPSELSHALPVVRRMPLRVKDTISGVVPTGSRILDKAPDLIAIVPRVLSTHDKADAPAAATGDILSVLGGGIHDPVAIGDAGSPPAGLGGAAPDPWPTPALDLRVAPSSRAVASRSLASVELTPSLSVGPFDSLSVTASAATSDGLGSRASAPAGPAGSAPVMGGAAAGAGGSSAPPAVAGLLLALLLLAPRLLRVLKEAPAFLRPAPFVALLERPG